MKPTKAWAVFDPDGDLELPTVSDSRRDAETLAMLGRHAVSFVSWEEMQREGYTCRRVIITEAQKRKGRAK